MRPNSFSRVDVDENCSQSQNARRNQIDFSYWVYEVVYIDDDDNDDDDNDDDDDDDDGVDDNVD